MAHIIVVAAVSTLSVNALARTDKERSYVDKPYGDNVFCWYSDAAINPTSITVQPARLTLVGSGGIKINAIQTAHDRYQISVDGSAINANSGTGASASTASSHPAAITGRINRDFVAAVDDTYFVTRTATCTLPSAVGAAGKEILVWNACPSGGTVTYQTTQSQTISGAVSRTNDTKYKLDRFMSDGENWYLE